jgi:hypothetical protein
MIEYEEAREELKNQVAIRRLEIVDVDLDAYQRKAGRGASRRTRASCTPVSGHGLES